MNDNELFASAHRIAVIENVFTLAVTGATVVGLVYFTGQWYHGLWGFLLLMNLNTFKVKKGE